MQQLLPSIHSLPSNFSVPSAVNGSDPTQFDPDPTVGSYHSLVSSVSVGQWVYLTGSHVKQRELSHKDSYIILYSFSTKKIHLSTAARPGFEKPPGCTSSPNSHLSPVSTTEKGMLPADYVLEDPDSHFIYVCTKIVENSNLSDSPAFSLTAR